MTPACCARHLPPLSDDRASGVRLALPWQWGTNNVTTADRANTEQEEKQISKERGKYIMLHQEDKVNNEI